ncbi:hypothetical protein D9757_012708 [Collybiopsis confluens]|uniref:Short-chain dehydrogenase/reductase n=1 Tax=Collybiopsis confluens TaxID=2823264 RepID=A0A8H5HFH1_9AGAR|nr:hypothetical protein D9757_012708 [Collybiopsis confluens]
MSDAIQKRCALITGCSEGSIGEALVKEFYTQGFHVFASSRNISTISKLAQNGIDILCIDVTQLDSIRAAKSFIEQKTGGSLDILVNNAGIAYAAAASDMSMERIRQLYDVNLFGAMTMVQEFLPLLLKSQNARIINIASLAGLMPVPFNSGYNSSKAALLSYGDTLRVELAPFNIKVINIAAGNVESNIMKGSERELPRESIYYPINENFRRDRIDHFQDGATPAAKFAQTVVGEAQRTNPRAWVYTANNSWTVWIISTCMGRKGFDNILSKMFGLKKLATIVALSSADSK